MGKPQGIGEEEELTLKFIVLQHINRISQLTCQEFTGGYWEEKPFKTPGGVMFSREYHQDIREAYVNAVDFLIDVLEPKGDKIFKAKVEQAYKDYETNIKDITDDKKL